MAYKSKQALARERQRDHKTRRPPTQPPKRSEPEPRARRVPTGTHSVDLKARSYQEIAQHLRASSRPVTWNTDEPDVD